MNFPVHFQGNAGPKNRRAIGTRIFWLKAHPTISIVLPSVNNQNLPVHESKNYNAYVQPQLFSSQNFN